MKKYVHLFLTIVLVACNREEDFDEIIVTLDKKLEISGNELIMEYSIPYMAFNYSIGDNFSLNSEPESTFRLSLVNAYLYQDGKSIKFDSLWNSNHDTLSFIPDEHFKIHLSSTSQIKYGVVLVLQQSHDGFEWIEVKESERLISNGLIGYAVTKNIHQFDFNELAQLESVSVGSHNLVKDDTLPRYADPIKIQFNAQVNQPVLFRSFSDIFLNEVDVAVFQNGERIYIDLKKIENGVEVRFDKPLCDKCIYDLKFTLIYFQLPPGGKVPIENSDGLHSQTFEYRFRAIEGTSNGISADNILFSYPANRQYHFLKNEYNKGYMKLKYPQLEIYKSDGSENYSMEVVITNVNGSINQSSNVTYKASELYFEYDIDGSLLQNETIYRVDFFEHSYNTEETKVFHSLYFRTSMFDTADEKFREMIVGENFRWPNQNFSHNPIKKLLFPEAIDKYEGKNQSLHGLIRVIPDLDNTIYYTNYIYPLVYLGVDQGILIPKTYTKYGFPSPVVNLLESHNKLSLTDKQIQSKNAERVGAKPTQFEDWTYFYAAEHYYDLKQRASRYYDQENPWINTISGSRFPHIDISDDEHFYYIQYVLPGLDSITHETYLSWKNAL